MRPALTLLLLAAVVAAGLRWGSFVAGGSDASCYLHQAQGWASGRLQVPEPLALAAPWPDAALTFAASGHVPSETLPGAIVPICPAGLSIAMAPFVAAGGLDAAVVVVPLFGALLVGATFAIASRFSRRLALPAALVAAASPVFLFQLVQPMSDVPAAALWLLATAWVTGTRRQGAALGGLAAGAAVLVRPNLVPLAIPLGLFLLLRPERTWRARVVSAATFAAGVLPGAVAVAAIHDALYGSPLASGYGPMETLYSLARVAPNALRYTGWLSETQTPIWALAAAAPLLLPGALTRLLLAMFFVNLACYLPYYVFEDWSFLRFLLPTIPLVLVLALACIDAICRRVRPWTARPVLALVAVALAVVYVREAESRSVFRLRELEARFEAAAVFADRRLPPNAVVVAGVQSGSVRFRGNRTTVVWDYLDPRWLEPALAWLRMQGFEPVLMLEPGEEARFRARFGESPTGRLDWPPAVEIASRVRVYDPDDRERYLRGEAVPTEYVGLSPR